MTEKMQEVARLVPPGGAFQGGPSKVFPLRYLSPTGAGRWLGKVSPGAFLLA